MLNRFLFLVLSCCCSGVFAQAADYKELNRAKKVLELEEQRFKKLKQEEKALSEESAQRETASQQILLDQKTIEKDLTRLDLEIGRIEQSSELTRGRVIVEEARLGKRLGAMYRFTKERQAVSFMLESALGDPASFLSRARYLTAVSSADYARFDSVQREKDAFDAEQARLAAARKEQIARSQELSLLQSEHRKRAAAIAQLLKQIAGKKAQQVELLAGLRSSVVELEQALSGIMGESESEAEYKGAGIPARIGAPVQGEILQRFGRQRHEEFSDMVFNKGYEYSAEIGAKVRPVALGKVILNQALPGFGNVVILDHGKRYYSLYGRLSSVLCRIGQVVTPKDSIAILGEADFRGRNFYFELRFKGQAIDPAKYLR